MSLTENEEKELASLIEKAESIEIRGEIWHQLVKKFITTPIELCILDDEGKVFMVYRKDREFDGYHIPGSVVNDWETVEGACNRLVQSEIITDAGIEITEPKPIGWIDSPRDVWPDEVSTRHGISLLYIAYFHGEFLPKEGMSFFTFDSIPDNTLGGHKFLLPFFKRYLEDGKPILGV